MFLKGKKTKEGQESAKEQYDQIGQERNLAKEENRIAIHCLAGLGRYLSSYLTNLELQF